MKKIIVFFVSICFSVNCYGIDLNSKTESQIRDDIRIEIFKRYKDSSSSVHVYLIDGNIKSYKEILNYLNNGPVGLIDNIDENTVKHSKKELIKIIDLHYPIFNVMLYMYKSEMKSFKKLHEDK